MLTSSCSIRDCWCWLDQRRITSHNSWGDHHPHPGTTFAWCTLCIYSTKLSCGKPQVIVWTLVYHWIYLQQQLALTTTHPLKLFGHPKKLSFGMWPYLNPPILPTSALTNNLKYLTPRGFGNNSFRHGVHKYFYILIMRTSTKAIYRLASFNFENWIL